MLNIIALLASTAESTGPATSQPKPNAFAAFIPIIAFVVILYIFVIRPNKKRATQFQSMLSNLKKGDKIMLQCGMVGTIAKIDETMFISVEIAQNVYCKFNKNAVSSIISNTTNSDINTKQNNNHNDIQSSDIMQKIQKDTCIGLDQNDSINN